jgi:ribonuclease HI
MNMRPEKYDSICSDSQVAQKALQPAKTAFPLVQKCQKEMNDISTQHTVELFLVPGYSRVRANEIADKLTRDGAVKKFAEPEPALGVSRQNIRRNIIQWIDNQQMAMWWVLSPPRDRLQN